MVALPRPAQLLVILAIVFDRLKLKTIVQALRIVKSHQKTEQKLISIEADAIALWVRDASWPDGPQFFPCAKAVALP